MHASRFTSTTTLASEAGRCWRLVLAAAALIVAGLVSLSGDVAIAAWCRQGDMPGDLRRLVMLSEVFAHGFGVIMILLTIALLVPDDRRFLPRIIACAFGAGLMANVLKVLVARTRPNHFDLQLGVTDTFLGLLPAAWPEGWSYAAQSFPSAHAATATGLAIGLAWLYPRGRVLFPVFAALAAAQRVVAGAHFVSDAFLGAATGCLWAAACFSDRGLFRLFRRVEPAKAPESVPLNIVRDRAA